MDKKLKQIMATDREVRIYKIYPTNFDQTLVKCGDFILKKNQHTKLLRENKI